MTYLTESEVDDSALAWLQEAGWSVAHGPTPAPGELLEERSDFGQVVLEGRLRDALVRLNPDLPAEALDDAFCKLLRSHGDGVPDPPARPGSANSKSESASSWDITRRPGVRMGIRSGGCSPGRELSR